MLDLKSYYDREVAEEAQRLKNTAYLIGEWIKGAFQSSDYVLRDIAGGIDPAELHYPSLFPAQHTRRSRWLEAKRNTIPDAFLVGLFDRHCILTHSPNPKGPLGFDASRRDYCRLLRDNPNAESIVTPLFLTNFNRYSITQARRIRSDNDPWLGLATIGIEVAMFSKLLDNIEINPGGVVTIIDNRLQLIARKPALPHDIGKKVGDASIQAFVDSDTVFGTFHRKSTVDGVERFVVLQKVSGLPFIVYVGDADSVWLADWHRRIRDVLGVVCLLIAAAIMLLRHHWQQMASANQLLALATTDALTGVYNRRYFLERTAVEFSRARRQASTIAVMMLDIDRFKQVNDAFGHAAGDRAIVACAAACRGTLRDVDVLGRMGGDEFTILLTDVASSHAAKVVERVRLAIEAVDVRADDGARIPLSASIGVVLVEEGACSMDLALAKADGLLYEAKSTGRNRSCIGRLGGESEGPHESA